MTKKEICHVCKREKKPYMVFLTNNPLSVLEYQAAREDGPICERCSQYYAMTHEFKDATEEEFKLAKRACEFARTMLLWWEKDKSLSVPDGFSVIRENMRDWEGNEGIAKWYRKRFKKKEEKNERKNRKEATPLKWLKKLSG